MPDLKNSRRSRSSKRRPVPPASTSRRDVLAVAAVLCLFSAGAVWFCSAQGWLLYFGDAVSHLNTARRIVDSRTPGIDQIGTPWLPVPHLLMIPFVLQDDWWMSGLAGAIPSALCFVAAGLFLYLSARLSLGSRTAAATASGLFVLNPNVLYMQSIPMTESVFFAALAGLLLTTLWFRQSQSLLAVASAAMFSNIASLTRYEGWFLIPFLALYLLVVAERRRLVAAMLFCVLAAAGPLVWLGYNAYYTGNAIEFYNGPYSAKAIYQRALNAGMSRYPGDHDWALAILYYRTAAQLCAGTVLTVVGLLGIAAALVKRRIWPVLFLLLPCVFYVLSMYSSGTPIFVPGLWPNSYYNTRYGLVAVLLFAMAGGALTALVPERWRPGSAVLILAAVVLPWLIYPRPDNWICWKESQVNSDARRQWTAQAAAYLKPRYQAGEGIFTSFGDLTGIVEQAGIPIRETLYDGNNPAWLAAVARPNLMLHEEWAVAFAGDSVATAVQKAGRKGPRYRLVQSIAVKNAAVVEIYKRD